MNTPDHTFHSPSFFETLEMNQDPTEKTGVKGIFYIWRIEVHVQDVLSSSIINPYYDYKSEFDKEVLENIVNRLKIDFRWLCTNHINGKDDGLMALSKIRKQNQKIMVDGKDLWITTDDCLYYLSQNYSEIILHQVLEIFWRSWNISFQTFIALTWKKKSDYPHWFNWKYKEWREGISWLLEAIKTTPPSASSNPNLLPHE